MGCKKKGKKDGRAAWNFLVSEAANNFDKRTAADVCQGIFLKKEKISYTTAAAHRSSG